MSREASGRKRTSLFLCAFVLPKTKIPVRNFFAHSFARAYACIYNKEHPIGGPVPGLRPCRLPPSRPPLPIPSVLCFSPSSAAHATVRPAPAMLSRHPSPAAVLCSVHCPRCPAVLLCRPPPSSAVLHRRPLSPPLSRPPSSARSPPPSAGRQFLNPASSFLISISKACCAA